MFFPIKDYNPTSRIAYLTIFIIIINTGIFLYQAILSPQPFALNIAAGAMVPYEIIHQENVSIPLETDQWGRTIIFKRDISPILSIFTSIFMHGSFLHLFGNMLFLWIFGNNIEDHLGVIKFIIFYFLCGIGASLTHVLFHMNSTLPVIGASGAVSGVMGAYLVLFPHARIRTLVFVFIFITFVDFPAFLFLVIWFIFQFMYAGASSGVAWMAHVGGFIIGVILIKQMRDKQKPVIEFLP
ncbi:MAG: rhomboid family intramembrane serine protease [Acidobacteria bacterium]|jgi:membrane associated rhomboid family serine protease|nr:rhomboid family intramembrane serine protease [Acidobacteriota bacterium]